MPTPLVSVIVPTRNSGRTLRACLESVRGQTYPRIEIIVIDRSSTDDTLAIARELADRVIEGVGPERCAQRNVGATAATGEVFIMIDSDMRLDPAVAIQAVRKLADPAVAAVVIPEESFGEGFWSECKRLERSFYVGVEWMEGARVCRAADFRRVGGYDEALVSGEDWSLHQRLAKLGRIARTETFIFHDEGRLSLAGTLRKKVYYAREFAAYCRRSGDREAVARQTSVLARYRLFFARPNELFARPLLGLGMLFLKTAEFAAGAVGLAWARLLPQPKRTVPGESRLAHVILTTRFWPSIGGKEMSIDRQAKGLVGRKDRVEILCFRYADQGDTAKFDAEYGLPVSRIGGWAIDAANRWYRQTDRVLRDSKSAGRFAGVSARAAQLTFAVVNALALFRLFRRRRRAFFGDRAVIHCHTFDAVVVALLARLIWRRSGYRVVFVNGYIHRRLNSRPLDWLIARIFRQVDLCLCVSRASAEALVAEFGVEPERAVAYGLWIEPESIDAIVPPDSYRNRPYENPARLLYVGRLEPDKGLDVLTRAVTLAVERGDAGRCHFTFIGDGAPQVERELADLASRCTNCDYLGRIAKPELWRHYAQADLVVIPSKWEEAGGNVALEAGAFGLPVVAARRGGLPEIVEAYPHHRLVGPHEADAYLAAIDGLWGEVRKVGRRAVWDETRRSLENFSFERKFGIFYEAVTRLMTERR